MRLIISNMPSPPKQQVNKFDPMCVLLTESYHASMATVLSIKDTEGRGEDVGGRGYVGGLIYNHVSSIP